MPRAGLDPERVTTAAVELVDAEGQGALTLARLAAALGVAPPSLYKHVGGLDDLVRRIAIRTGDTLADRLAAAAVGRSGPDALVAIADAYRAFALLHPGTYPLAQAAPSPDDTDHARAAVRILDVLRAALAGYRVPADRMVDALRTVRSSLHGFVDLERRGGFGMPESVDGSFGFLVRGLDAALRSLAVV